MLVLLSSSENNEIMAIKISELLNFFSKWHGWSTENILSFLVSVKISNFLHRKLFQMFYVDFNEMYVSRGLSFCVPLYIFEESHKVWYVSFCKVGTNGNKSLIRHRVIL